ncbi:efflux RND transporter periplasmic adaptor subunit [Luteimonas huabeiensis]|uniref:efflux RND transporter periplasmic adaptor subunit n=1 Tax=Luteimonas huabeiensis TaxID=1244513 RepID=UPI0004676121|nr:efflux RND transporter periplasmic adaptor subunit [Luteimonas huabeiensis]
MSPVHGGGRWIVPALAVLLFAAGFGLARWTAAPAPAQAETAHDDGAGDAHEDAAPDALALDPARIEAAGIAVVAPMRGGGEETELAGRVEAATGARAVATAGVGGSVERVLVAPGAAVRAGDALVALASGEAAGLRAAAEAAAAEAEAARLAYRRDAALGAQGIVARQDVEAARARSLAAEAAARAAAAALRAAGAPDADGRVRVRSPIDGVVGAVRAVPGRFVAPGEALAEVADPARSELVFAAAPALAQRLRAGDRVRVELPAGTLDAEVTGVAAAARAGGGAEIRARADDPAALPAAGTPVRGRLLAGLDAGGALSVPAEAVQTLDGRAVVFVRTGDGFRAVPVLAGRRAGDRVEILRGLDGDDRVAGANAFLLKAELAKGDADHGH